MVISPPKPIKGTTLTILGCGTSTGTPLLACRCKTCSSKNPKNMRTRASVYIQTSNRIFLIDTSTDLRFQALRAKLFWIDAVLFTHPHADHIHGIDELRSFNYLMQRSLPCYGNQWTIDAIRTRFHYIFESTQEGGGKPKIEPHLVEKLNIIEDIQVQSLELVHGSQPVTGYRINNVAYITDCSYIPEHTFQDLKNLEVLVLDCLRPKKHSTHLSIEESIRIAKRVGAKRTYFTHMGHEIEYRSFSNWLPENMYPAYDGLTITTKA